MKRMLFVYNPNSGMGLLKPKLSDVIDPLLEEAYASIEVVEANIEDLVKA